METIDSNTAYEISRLFQVPQRALFNAFVDEAILRKIWGVSSITVDARPGGQARARLQIEDENWDFTVTYEEVSSPEKLRWAVHFDRFPHKEIRVTLWFNATADGAEVTIRMENFETTEERDANRQAWEAGLTTLEALIGNE